MQYERMILLKDGRRCVLRNGTEADAKAVLDSFILTHSQTDYLTSYPDECTFTVEQEKEFLRRNTDSDREIELVAEVGGVIVGTAGVQSIGTTEKLKHRASFGISLDRAWWGQGIGGALTAACIECAEKAGYAQLELEVVGENTRALSLYQRAGFVEYGRNPKGFRSRLSGWQELILMRRELN